jgi:glycosyltransferase involved in cell wall biosynthesis
MDRFRPDVCHANEFHIVPQVLSANGGKYPVSGHIRLSIASNQIVTYGISGCGTIVAVSKAVASLLNGSGLESRVRVVYNGVDVGHFSPDGPPAAILGSGGENVGSRIRFGLFGLVNERKNQLLAVEALSRVVGRGIDAYLLLAGDAHSSSPAYAERLRARIAQPDLAGRVTWLPFQSDVPALYRSIDVNLLPSQMEGFGRTIIEASALRRPSIGARVGGIPEVIEDGRTGWLVEAGDVEGLAAIMADLAAKPGLIQSAGEAALARTETVFGIKAHAARMIEVWNETIASHKAGAH